MRKDISGEKFGKLTAIKPVRSEKKRGVIWLCQCDCGGWKEVPASQLIRGTTKSCGCLSKENRRRTDITGKRFGRLVAKSFQYYDSQHRDCWLFTCDCGKEKIMPAAFVKWGNTHSCGCLLQEHTRELHRQDITRKRFFRLTAVRPTEERDATGSVIWECRCDCGNTAKYSVNALQRGKIHSCGCMYQETRSECASYRKDLIEDTALSSLIVSKRVRKGNTSGCTGVSMQKNTGKWIAYIDFQKKRYFLGVYSDKNEAISARKMAEQQFHDPILMEKMDRLTLNSKKQFQDYLVGQK